MQKNYVGHYWHLVIFVITIFSCTKVRETPSSTESPVPKRQNVSVLASTALGSLIDSMPPLNPNDTIEHPTILGIQMTNPYTVPIMQQAYANLGITSVNVIATNL